MSPEKERQLRDSFRGKVKEIEDASRGASTNNKSIQWFQNTLKKSLDAQPVQKPRVGSIYTFTYFAKHRKTLPYWDRFPLSVCFSVQGDMWRSINLHYLPPKMRAEFLEELLVEYANAPTRRSGKLNERTRLNIDWGKLKNFDRGIAEHAITSYLYSNIKTPMMEVPPEEWYMATGMPMQQFMSGGKRYSAKKVWAQARR